MKEIYPGIFMITEKGLINTIKPPVNIYVIAGNDGLIFDAGYGDKKSIKYFQNEIAKVIKHCKQENIPCSIKKILPSHSHGDHFSGLNKLHKLLGYEILLTKKIADRITSKEKFRESYKLDIIHNEYSSSSSELQYQSDFFNPVIRKFYESIFGIEFVNSQYTIIPESGEISINGEKWQIFPSPGHSADHISLYDPVRGILFGGDNVLRSVTTWLGPPHSDIDRYLQSLKEMLELPNLKIILSSHGSPITNPHKRIQEIIDWREKRANEVYSIVESYNSKGISIKKIIKKLYPNDMYVKQLLAKGWVTLTLQYMVNKNKISARIKNRREIYYINK